MTNIPENPVMLLSYVNTQLRDNYASLSELCSALDADADAIKNKLAAIDYHYDENLNKFI